MKLNTDKVREDLRRVRLLVRYHERRIRFDHGEPIQARQRDYTVFDGSNRSITHLQSSPSQSINQTRL